MGRKPKDGVAFNIKMKREVFERLTIFCEETGRSKTGTVEVALLQYMEKEEKKMGVNGKQMVPRTERVTEYKED